MNIGEAIITQLAALGVDTLFGIPGVHTAEMYRALPDSGIRHITPRHEQGAAFMADGYARVSGKPGVCLLITGPGLTNAATPIAQAYADSVPMLVLTSVNPESTWGKGLGRLHDLPDQSAFAASICAMSMTIRTASDIAPTFAKAWSLFTHERPRPVHIQVPLDVVGVQCPTIDFAVGPDPQCNAGDKAAIDRAAHLLQHAEQPVMIVGGGCQSAANAVQTLAEHVTLPVFNTFAAKGLMPVDHALNAGSFLGTPAVRAYVADADVVLACGTEFSATDLHPHFDMPINQAFIHIDMDASCSPTQKQPDVMITGDSADVLSALNSHYAGLEPPTRPAWIERLATLRASTEVDAPFSEWLEALARSVPGEVIISADSTQLVYAGNNAMSMHRPRSWITSVTGYGTLGFALPAGIGAALACPQRPVVCLVGDGGLQFTLPELMVAIEHQLPIAIVVWDNNGYAEIRDYMVHHSVTPDGVDIKSPDLPLLAKAYGCHHTPVTHVDALGPALSQAFGECAPTLIEIPV